MEINEECIEPPIIKFGRFIRDSLDLKKLKEKNLV